MQILKVQDPKPHNNSFSHCGICSRDMPLGPAYFCQLCENVNVCEPCFDETRRNMNGGEYNNCLPHLIKVAYEKGSAKEIRGISSRMETWLPMLLDTAHSQSIEIRTRGSDGGSAIPTPMLLISSEHVNNWLEEDEVDLTGINTSILYEYVKQHFRDPTNPEFGNEERALVSTSYSHPLSAIVYNTHSTLIQKFLYAFGNDGKKPISPLQLFPHSPHSHPLNLSFKFMFPIFYTFFCFSEISAYLLY